MVKSPSSLVVATRAIAVCSFLSMTLAPAITLPEASTTVPEIVPVMVWAIASPHKNTAQNRQDNNFDHCNLMVYMGVLLLTARARAGNYHCHGVSPKRHARPHRN